MPRLRWLLISSLTVLLPAASSAQTTYTWNNTNPNWGTPSSWTPAGPPTATDPAQFIPGGSLPGTTVVNPTITGPQTAFSLTTSLNQNLGGWAFGGTGSLTLGNTAPTALTTFGPQTTAFTGPTLAGAGTTSPLAFNVGTSSTLVLAGNTAVTANQGNVNVLGGRFVLDNTATNLTGRLLTTGTVRQQGGGVFELVGGAAGGTYNVGSYNTADNSVGGVNTIRVTPAAGASAATVLNFANTGTFSLRQGTRNVTVFEATTGELGSANGPAITFTGTPFTGAGGLLTNSNGGTTPGWGIVRDSLGTQFATYSTTPGVGIVSIASSAAKPATAFLTTVTTAAGVQGLTAAGAAGAGSNGQFNAPAATETLTADAAAASLRISPAGAGGQLAAGSFNLRVAGLMLDGPNDYTISASATPGSLFAGTHYVYVNNPSATLTTGLVLTTSGNQFVFAGPGFLDLNNTVSQNAAGTARITVGGGVLRANEVQLGLTAAGSGQLNLTGGVLEIKGGANGTGSAADFRRTLGTGTGSVNFGGATTAEQGSGGFSAFGSNASVNIGGASATLQWNQPNFVGDGFALTFGSTKSNAVVTFENPVQLDNGTAYQLREVRVTAGAGGDRTVFSGAVTGAANADFVKTGTGTLELSAANTYAGNTLVQGGRLLVTGSVAAGTSFVAVGPGAALGGTGAVNRPVFVRPAGAIRGGTAAAPTGTLTVGNNVNLTAQPGGAGSVIEVGATRTGANAAAASLVAVTGGTFNIDTLGGGNRFGVNLIAPNLVAGETYTIDLATATGGIRRNGAAPTGANSFTSADVTLSAANFASFSNVSLTTGSADTVLRLTFTPVPEPATVLLAGAAGLGLVRLARRRRSNVAV